MAMSPSEMYREASVSIERRAQQIQELMSLALYERQRRDREAERTAAELAALRREVADQRTEVALGRRDQAEALRRSEVWAARWWGLAVAVTVALAGGGVAILRKYP